MKKERTKWVPNVMSYSREEIDVIKMQCEWKTHFSVFIKRHLWSSGYDCSSTAGGPGSITGRGTKIPHATQGGQKKKKVDTNKIQIKCKTSNWSGVDSNPPAHCPVTLRTDLILLNLEVSNST